MRYQIVYDKPGRLRVRCGGYAFSQEQGYGIAALLLSQQGVLDASANAANGGLLVTYQPGCRGEILAVIRSLHKDNLPAGTATPADNIHEIDNRFQHGLARLFLWRVVPRLLHMAFLPEPIYFAYTLWRAIGFWKRGLKSLAAGKLDVAVLDAASIGAAFLQGASGTAGSIMFLLSLSDLLEDYTRRRTKNALTNSLAINVDQVWLVRESGSEVSFPLSQLTVGDHIRVRTGAMIPVDGTVTEGEALINEATMTGESMPVEKRVGSTVFAGTLVEEGSVILCVSALANESRISQIVGLIENSEQLKADVQGRAEHLADAIVPFSFFGAIAVGLLTRSLTKALAVLMVDYSCAIKLSTPICVISAMREASNEHIVVKGGKFLEILSQADTIVFDKTGTLTEACPQVADILVFEGYSREEILRTAACIEEHFPHSMARAVVRQAQREQLQHEEQHAEVEYIVAHGVATTLHGEKAIIGSAHFAFDDEKTEYPPEKQQAVLACINGSSALYLAIGGRLVGVICINDPPRREAAESIALLRRYGLRHIVMLTGDHESAAAAISRTLGINEYRAQVLPEDKARLIEEMKAAGRKVIMVGDGINDSPALAAADVSVSMKDSSDIAREVADITLLSGDLRRLAVIRALSQGMMRRIRNNYSFIVAFNTALLLLGLAGTLQPTTTAFLHNFSTMAISAGNMRTLLPSERGELQREEAQILGMGSHFLYVDGHVERISAQIAYINNKRDGNSRLFYCPMAFVKQIHLLPEEMAFKQTEQPETKINFLANQFALPPFAAFPPALLWDRPRFLLTISDEDPIPYAVTVC